MKVALCFWGLTRSLKYTLHSIKKYILNVFNVHNIEYKIFLHTYYFHSIYNNPRAGETNIDLDFDEHYLLNPDFLKIENQDTVKEIIDVFKYRSQPDPWESNYACVDNFLCAMYSKKQLGIMVENSNIDFDYIIYLRPDVRYLTYFDMKYFSLVNQYNVCTPNFHLFPNLNDRFCMLLPSKLKKYYLLFDKMYEYSLLYPLHSERFQYNIMVKLYKWSIRYIPILFNRVRADGTELHDAGINIKKMKKKSKEENKRITPIVDNNKVVKPLFKFKT